MLCLIPLLLAGYAIPMGTAYHSSDLTPSAIVSAQTCATGPGAYAKATMTGAYMAGLQYGFGVERNGFEFSIKPQVGLSYIDHHVQTLPAREQYHVGGEINVCYAQFCSGFSFEHLSNGRALGLCWSGADCRPNFGDNMFAFTTGFIFTVQTRPFIGTVFFIIPMFLVLFVLCRFFRFFVAFSFCGFG